MHSLMTYSELQSFPCVPLHHTYCQKIYKDPQHLVFDFKELKFHLTNENKTVKCQCKI